MYPYRYFRYLNLPPIPENLLDQLPRDFDSYQRKDPGKWGDGYKWTDSHNQDINAWCQANICDSMYWGFQIIKSDLAPHIDNGTKYKLVYLIDTGGPDILTEWFDQELNQVDSVILEAKRWHMLKVDSLHSVRGLLPGAVRHSVTGRLF